MTFRAAVAGASGYAGGEMLRLLAAHPNIDIVTVTAASSAGSRLGDHHRHLGVLGDLVIAPTSVETLSGHDLVVLALPHGHSGAIGDALASSGDHAVIVDLAADHRLNDKAEWERYYGGEFSLPWTYSMPELLYEGEAAAKKQRSALQDTTRIAVPGCNATAVTLAAQCLIHSAVIDPAHLVATLAVGYSGAGRTLKSHLLASEALGNLAPYAVGGTHRHIPEILQNLRCAQSAFHANLTFTPVLAPVSRGILATVVAPLAAGVGAGEIEAAFEPYQDEPLIQVLPPGVWATTGPLTGTGLTQISWAIDERADTVTVLAAIDNLGKGTASAAIQGANLALGLPELTGVPTIGVAP
ncbi:MAG: N-acetyl-gamma-glutamyl-phosphate reductase [Actinomycetaceae bacterium]|nr:N-acetyl-gamma-glutamyl-phosphate reductase [Actinomycetaceae bacterium]